MYAHDLERRTAIGPRVVDQEDAALDVLEAGAFATTPPLTTFILVDTNSFRALALTVDCHLAARAHLASSVLQDVFRWALTVGGQLGGVPIMRRCISALLVRLCGIVPVGVGRTEAFWWRTESSWVAGILAGLIDKNLAWSADPLTVRRRADGAGSAFGSSWNQTTIRAVELAAAIATDYAISENSDGFFRRRNSG